MVGRQLELVAVGALSPRRPHHARVVDQEVDPVGALAEPGGEGAHRVEAREIERGDLGARVRDLRVDRVERLLAALGVAAGEDHPGAVARELERGDQPEAAVRPGDDSRAPGLIDDPIGGPLGGHRTREPTAASVESAPGRPDLRLAR